MNEPKPIRAVLMDVDGTLYRQSTVRRQMALRLLGFTVRQPKKGWRTIRAIQCYREAQECIRAGSLGNVASGQIALASQFAGQPQLEMDKIVRRWLETEPLDAVRASRFQGVIEFFQWAQSSNLLLAVVSDYPATAKLQSLGLMAYLSVVVSAQDPDVNCFKPNPKGLLKAIGQLGVAPEQAVYIGDRDDVDLAAAAAAGIKGILLRHRPPSSGACCVPTWGDLKVWVAGRI